MKTCKICRRDFITSKNAPHGLSAQSLCASCQAYLQLRGAQRQTKALGA